MLIYNESGKEIKSPDLEAGYIDERGERVFHTWTDDGWVTKNEAGDVVPYGEVDPELEHGEDVPDWWQYGVYVPYTPEQIEEIAEERADVENAEKVSKWLPTAPEQVSALEAGVDDNFDATAELGIEVANQSIALDDIMDAIAELGTVITNG